MKSTINIPVPVTIHHNPHKGEAQTNHSPEIQPYTDIYKITLDELEITPTHPVFNYLPDDGVLEEVALLRAIKDTEEDI